MSTITLDRLHGLRISRSIKVDVVSAGLLTALLAAVVFAVNGIVSATGSDNVSHDVLLWALIFAALALCVRRVGIVAHVLLRALSAWKQRVDSGVTGTAAALTARDVRMVYQVEVARARGI